MSWPMMVYSAVMLAMCVAILRKMYGTPKNEYVDDSKSVFEATDPNVIRRVGLYTVSFILCYFWLVALVAAQPWLLIYAGYKTIDAVCHFRTAIKPQGGTYPSLFRKLATWTDLVIIFYFVADGILHR